MILDLLDTHSCCVLTCGVILLMNIKVGRRFGICLIKELLLLLLILMMITWCLTSFTMSSCRRLFNGRTLLNGSGCRWLFLNVLGQLLNLLSWAIVNVILTCYNRKTSDSWRSNDREICYLVVEHWAHNRLVLILSITLYSLMGYRCAEPRWKQLFLPICDSH